MEKCQRSAEHIQKYGDLTVQEMARRARVRALLALVGSSSGNKHMQIVNRDFNAAFNIR